MEFPGSFQDAYIPKEADYPSLLTHFGGVLYSKVRLAPGKGSLLPTSPEDQMVYLLSGAMELTCEGDVAVMADPGVAYPLYARKHAAVRALAGGVVYLVVGSSAV